VNPLLPLDPSFPDLATFRRKSRFSGMGEDSHRRCQRCSKDEER
jgi:hypothetical protein